MTLICQRKCRCPRYDVSSDFHQTTSAKEFLRESLARNPYSEAKTDLFSKYAALALYIVKTTIQYHEDKDALATNIFIIKSKPKWFRMKSQDELHVKLKIYLRGYAPKPS